MYLQKRMLFEMLEQTEATLNKVDKIGNWFENEKFFAFLHENDFHFWL